MYSHANISIASVSTLKLNFGKTQAHNYLTFTTE